MGCEPVPKLGGVLHERPASQLGTPRPDSRAFDFDLLDLLEENGGAKALKVGSASTEKLHIRAFDFDLLDLREVQTAENGLATPSTQPAADADDGSEPTECSEQADSQQADSPQADSQQPQGDSPQAEAFATSSAGHRAEAFAGLLEPLVMANRQAEAVLVAGTEAAAPATSAVGLAAATDVTDIAAAGRTTQCPPCLQVGDALLGLIGKDNAWWRRCQDDAPSLDRRARAPSLAEGDRERGAPADPSGTPEQRQPTPAQQSPEAPQASEVPQAHTGSSDPAPRLLVIADPHGVECLLPQPLVASTSSTSTSFTGSTTATFPAAPAERGPALDAPSPALFEFLAPLRERLLRQIQDSLRDYDAGRSCPRPQDRRHDHRDGLEAHVRSEAVKELPVPSNAASSRSKRCGR